MNASSISPAQLAELCKEGKKIELIDVRTPVEFREVHVEIARNVPLDRLDAAALMQARNGSANEPLYVICRSGGRGQQACEKFLKAGFSNVVNVEGGTMACVEAGLPVVRGKKAILAGAASSYRSRIAGSAGGRTRLVRASRVHRAIGFRRSRTGLRRNHRHLRHGHDPGPHALEPMRPQCKVLSCAAEDPSKESRS